jgi:hypothetical protein
MAARRPASARPSWRACAGRAALPAAPAGAAALPLRRCSDRQGLHRMDTGRLRRRLKADPPGASHMMTAHARTAHPAAVLRRRRPPVPDRRGLARPITEAVNAVISALTAGGKLLLCGQGGGACWRSTCRAAGRPAGTRTPAAGRAEPSHPTRARSRRWACRVTCCCWSTRRPADLDASMAAVRAAQGKDMTVVLLVGTSGAVCVKLWPRPTF